MHFDAPATQEAGDAEAVGVVDLPRRQWLTGLAQFVTTAEQANAQRPVYRDPVQANAGQQAEVLGAQFLAGAKQRIANAKLFPATANVAAVLDDRNLQPVAIGLAVFLGNHAVRAWRQRCAGEDAHGLPRLQLDLGCIASSDIPGKLQSRAGWARVGAAQGITVHRTVVPQRQVDG